MLKSIKKLFNALENNNIRYCHWKSNEHLKEALDGDTDLDMLFDPVQRTELERIFDECGLKRFRATPLMQYNAIEDFIGFDQDEGKIWHVHTHYKLTLGESHLKGYTISPWGSIILNNRIRGTENVWTSDPADELVLLLCRIALKFRWRDCIRELGKDDKTEIAWLKKRAGRDKVDIAARNLVGKKCRHIILRLYDADLDNKNQFIELQDALRNELLYYTSYSRFFSWITRTKREIFWLYGGIKRRMGLSSYIPNRRVSPSGGVVVAILGCDGAGKSTTLEYVKKEFSKKLDVASIYFGSGDGSSSLLRKPMKLVAKRVGGKGVGHAVDKEYSEHKSISLKSKLYSFAKIIWAITLAKEKKSKQRQMVKARNNGMLVLTDRYPQSNMPGASDGPLLDRYRNGTGILKLVADWERRIYESFSINPPDLTVKLMVPTDLAIARKPEMTIDEIENKKKIVMDMNISEHTVVIDTSRPFEITRGEVMKEIWNLI